MTETDLLTLCQCPVCRCQAAVVAQIQDSICFECRELLKLGHRLEEAK